MALSLVACAGDEAGNTSTSPQFTSHATVEALGQAVSTATGAKKSAKLREVKLVNGERVTNTGLLRFGPAGPAIDVTASAPSGPVRLVVTDGAAYVRLPGVSGDPDRPWIKGDPNRGDSASGLLAAILSGLQVVVDPGQSLLDAKTVSTMEPGRPEKIDGVDTFRYEVKIDYPRLAEVLTDLVKKQGVAAAVKMGQREVTMEIWIDRDDLPVKTRVRAPGKSPQPAESGFYYTEWGSPVDIVAPAPAEIGVMPG